MEPNKTAIERAFELAQSGRFLEVGEIKERLRDEGYFIGTITGPTLYGQLKLLMETSQTARWKPPLRRSSAGGGGAANGGRVKRPNGGSSTAHA